MVKLQKSLTKPVELVEKRKKKVPSPPLAGISKPSKKDKQKASLEKTNEQKKEKLIKAIVKEDNVIVPAKKAQKNVGKTAGEKVKEKPLKNLEKNNKKTIEKPLVLAESIGKKKNAANPTKKPLVLAPPASPAAPKHKLKKQKKKGVKPVKEENKQNLTPQTKLRQKSLAKRAYKKKQIKDRRLGKKKAKKAPLKRLYEAPPFDEDKFNAIVNEENIMKIAKVLKEQVEKEVAAKKTAIFSDFQYFLNVTSFKISNTPKRMVKLNLKHSLVDKEDDIAIIVADLQRGAKVDYDPTIQHYEDLFREAGIEGLTIIPFNKLRNECTTFETVRKFGNTYDYFLCDGRLVRHASGFCGKIFQKPRTTFHSVRMDNPNNLKREIEKSLKRTAYKQLKKGDLISIPIGSHKFTEKQLAENIMFVMEQFKQTYPGSLPNIRSMCLKISIAGTSALPIYVSVAEPPTDVPNVIGPREQRMLKLKREANEILTNFNLTKQGEFVKLSRFDSERKRKLKEMRAVIDAPNTSIVIDTAGNKENGKQSVVPAKKAKTEKSVTSTSGKAEKEKEKPSVEKEADDEGEDDGEAEQEGEDEHGSGEDDSGDDDDGDEDDDDDDDEDDDDGDDDNEDDDDDDDEDEAGDDNDSSDNNDEDDDDDDDE